MKSRNLALLIVLLAGVTFVLVRTRSSRPTPGPAGSQSETVAESVLPAAAPVVESFAANMDPPPSGGSISPMSRPAQAVEFDEIAKLTDDAQRRRLVDKLFQKWVLDDAPGAAGFVLTVENEDQRKEAMLSVMQTWGVQDAGAALTWAATAAFANDYEREVAMSMTCSQVARTDPAEALRLALQHKLDESADGLCEGLTARWAETDLPAARDWVFAQPAGAPRDRLIESLALVMFENSPAKASQLILDQIPAGEGQDKAILSLAGRLALQNPEQAQQWVATFPEGELRERAMNNLDAILNRQTEDE
jgi:hypothetical protein